MMSWQEIKSAVLAWFERVSQTCWYQQEQVLRPIPIESRQQHPRHPR